MLKGEVWSISLFFSPFLAMLFNAISVKVALVVFITYLSLFHWTLQIPFLNRIIYNKRTHGYEFVKFDGKGEKMWLLLEWINVLLNAKMWDMMKAHWVDIPNKERSHHLKFSLWIKYGSSRDTIVHYGYKWIKKKHIANDGKWKKNR